MNYFRITGYYRAKNVCFIADCNGKFEEIWEFSSYLVHHGVNIIEVTAQNKFLEGDMPLVEQDTEHFILRACDMGKPKLQANGVEVHTKTYIPDKFKFGGKQ